MSGLVDNTGKEMNTKEEANSDLPKEEGEAEGVMGGATPGDEKGPDAKEAVQQPENVARIEVVENTFVVKIPVHNNLYQVIGQLAWAEDKIRQIYMDAQMRKAQSALAKPTGFLKGFRNKWGR